MHISLTGDLGSGKSSVAKILCDKLNYKFISTGVIHRQLGLEKGMNTLEFNKYINDNTEIDHYIDQHLKDINESNESYILDSRLAWFFVNKSFKVYLIAFKQIAAQRIVSDKNRIGEPNVKDVEIKIIETEKRRTIENLRFEKNYGAKCNNLTHFDLIIDTSFVSTEEVAQMILTAYSKWKQNLSYTKIWFSTPRIYPLKNINIIDSEAAKEIRKSMEKQGFDENFPISLLKLSDYYFIYDGHKRFSASLFNQLSIIPVEIITDNKEDIKNELSVEQYVKENYKLNTIHDWETTHNFKYFEYPTLFN